MKVRQTYTFAELEVSAAAYDEIAGKLREAGYDHAFMKDIAGATGKETIDMHGIGLTRGMTEGRAAAIERAARDLEETLAKLINAGETKIVSTDIGAAAVRDRLQALHEALKPTRAAEQPASNTLSSLLCDVAQFMDGCKIVAPKEWTAWDQTVRDRLSEQLALLEAAKRVTAADLSKTVDARASHEPPADREPKSFAPWRVPDPPRADAAEALRPFVELFEKSNERYRKRGGNPDQFPDKHPFREITATELPLGVWRRAQAALRTSQPPGELRPGLERAEEIISAIETPADQYEPYKTRLLDALRDAIYSSETKEPSRDLLAYGYAPGNYMSNCLTCGQNMQDVDKRCRTCKPCAEKKMRAALGEEGSRNGT